MKQTELQKLLGDRMVALNKSNLSSEELAKEIELSKAMARLAKEMVRNANLIINAKKYVGTLNKQLVDEVI